MTHDAKPTQISSKTTIWVLRCKKEVRFSFHFFFQLNFFFSFSASKVGQLLTGKQNTNQPEKIKNMILQQKQNSNWSSKVMFLRKFMTCFSKSNECHHANHGSITTYQPSKWLRNIDVFPKLTYYPSNLVGNVRPGSRSVQKLCSL